MKAMDKAMEVHQFNTWMSRTGLVRINGEVGSVGDFTPRNTLFIIR